MNGWIHLLTLTVFLISFEPPFAWAAPNDRRTGFSNVSVTPCSEGNQRRMVILRSPDRQKAVSFEGGFRLVVDVSGWRHSVEYAAWPCPELKWSADSRAFFLNYSNGGSVGEWEVRVYYPSRAAVQRVDPAPSVVRDFLLTYPKCFEPEMPNVAGIAWLKGSQRLLVATQVLPHSNCDSMGTFAVYEVEVLGAKILHRYGQLEAKQRFWQFLGPELRAADDQCIRSPQSCWIPALHGR